MTEEEEELFQKFIQNRTRGRRRRIVVRRTRRRRLFLPTATVNTTGATVPQTHKCLMCLMELGSSVFARGSSDV